MCASTSSSIEIEAKLGRKINLPDIDVVVAWALNDDNIIELFSFAGSSDERVAYNALWCLQHLQKIDGEWLQSRQNDLIDMLLREVYSGKKRILLALLREQSYTQDAVRTDFIDYCIAKINSECESYAVRCFSLYCAFKMCKFFPELLVELEEVLNLLSMQSLSPGLNCALHTTRRNIKSLLDSL